MFSSSGILMGFINPLKLIVQVDLDLFRYYRSLIPKYIKLNLPKYPSHISVIRNESILDFELFEKYSNQIIYFQYSNEIFFDSVYGWLAVESKELEKIRLNLGLTSTKKDVTLSPDEQYPFHITLGNFK